MYKHRLVYKIDSSSALGGLLQLDRFDRLHSHWFSLPPVRLLALCYGEAEKRREVSSIYSAAILYIKNTQRCAFSTKNVRYVRLPLPMCILRIFDVLVDTFACRRESVWCTKVSMADSGWKYRCEDTGFCPVNHFFRREDTPFFGSGTWCNKHIQGYLMLNKDCCYSTMALCRVNCVDILWRFRSCIIHLYLGHPLHAPVLSSPLWLNSTQYAALLSRPVTRFSNPCFILLIICHQPLPKLRVYR